MAPVAIRTEPIGSIPRPRRLLEAIEASNPAHLDASAARRPRNTPGSSIWERRTIVPLRHFAMIGLQRGKLRLKKYEQECSGPN